MKKTIEIEIPDGFIEKISNSDNKIIIELVKTNKKQEMVDFLKPFLTDLTLIKNEKYPNSVFFKKDGEVIFELHQDSKNKEIRYFWVDYYSIWSVFGAKFGLNHDETQSFIKEVVEDTLKLGSVTPRLLFLSFLFGWKTL